MAMRVSLCSLIGIWGLLLASNNANALVLLHDQFLQTGPLAGKTPMPGPGVTWNPGAQTGVNAVSVVNTSASPVNNEVALVQSEAVNGEDIANVFADRSATSTTYVRFDFRLPSAENATLATDADILAEGLFFVTLRGSSASTSQRGRVGFVPPVTSGYRMAINADNGDLVVGAGENVFPLDLAFDTTYRAVFSFDPSTAKSKLWIDPLDETSTSVEHAGASTSIGTVINRIILRQHNTFNGKEFVDNVVVATTFADALNPPVIIGDFNADGVVDAGDYVVWRKNNGITSGAAVSQGDSDGDGDVDNVDYNYWRALFGNNASPGFGSRFTAVPEPSAAVLVTYLCLFSALRRKSSILQRDDRS